MQANNKAKRAKRPHHIENFASSKAGLLLVLSLLLDRNPNSIIDKNWIFDNLVLYRYLYLSRISVSPLSLTKTDRNGKLNL